MPVRRNSLTKLQVRLHTLSYARDFLDDVITAAKSAGVEALTAAEAGFDDHPGMAPDDIVTVPVRHDELQRALQAADLHLGPRRWHVGDQVDRSSNASRARALSGPRRADRSKRT